MRRRSQPGFTLIELLVVIAIIAVLMALLVPAVQKVREAAARTQCQNNLRQVGLALHQHHDSHKFFPPGGVTQAIPQLGIPQDVQHGWAIFLLPYLEQDNLYRQYRLDLDWRDAVNGPVVTQPIPILVCPISPSIGQRDTFSSGGYRVTAALSDYAPINGVVSTLAGLGLIEPVKNYHGVMRVNVLARIADISDGTSNTMLIAEDAGRPLRYRGGIHFPGGRFSGGGWADRDAEYLLHGFTFDGTSNPGPCAINCTNANEIYAFHTGGANAVFADASVRYLSSSASIRLVAALITRAGGEVDTHLP